MTPTEPLKPLELLKEFLAARLTHCHLPGFEYVPEGAGFDYSRKKLRQTCRADLLIRESIGIAELRKLDGAPFARLLYPSPDPAATIRDALLLAERLLAVDTLLSQTVIDADPAKTRREALHVIADIIGDVNATKPPKFPEIELRPYFEQLAALAALCNMSPPVELHDKGLAVSLVLWAPNGARQDMLVRRDMMHKRTPLYEDRFDYDARKQLFACLGKWKRRLEEPLEAVERERKTPIADEAKGPAQQLEPVASLKPCESNAYLLYQHAEDQTERRLQDREAYDWLKANDWPEGLFPGASDYTLPTFSTWTKYVRAGRSAHGTSKRRRRAPSTTTRSVVRQRDLDSRRDD